MNKTEYMSPTSTVLVILPRQSMLVVNLSNFRESSDPSGWGDKF